MDARFADAVELDGALSTRSLRPLLALLGILLAAGAVQIAIGSALAAAPRASFTDVEAEVMCVSCREPLAVAQSPQARFERNYIRRLIAQGLTKPQIEAALVAQYGPAVLGRPPARGFNLTVYILPPALLIIGAAVLAFTLPRWRRRTRAAGAPAPPPPSLDPAQASRLERELARFDA